MIGSSSSLTSLILPRTHAQHDRRDATGDEPHADAREADGDVAEDLAALDHRHHGLEHHQRRRNQEAG